MKFIYDIILNFGDMYYEFYDWNKEDKITHIRKIPIIKVNDKIMKTILKNKVKTDVNFLEKIKNKTEIFTKRNIEYLDYACLLCTDKKVIGIKLDNTGRIIYKSDLLIDEHDDILECTGRFIEAEFNIVIVDKESIDNFKTRNQIVIEKFIIEELNNQEVSKLKYLLYECLNEVSDDRNVILSKLKNSMNVENNKKMYEFLRLVKKDV